MSSGVHQHGHGSDDVFTWPRLYDWAGQVFSFGRRRRVYERLAQLLDATAPATVLDVGSGTGTLAIALRRRFPGAEVIGVEPGGPMVARARAKAARDGLDIDFQQGHGQRLLLDDGTVDAVTIALALHHVAEADVPEVLAEALRVLRPGGVLLIVEFAPIGTVARLASLHPHGHDLSDYADQVRAAGFADVRAGRATPRLLGHVSGRAPTVDRDVE